MSLDEESTPKTAGTAAPAALSRVRRSSLVALVLIVVEFGFGMYVNLYATIPQADHDSGLGSAIGNGPATLSIHAVLGLLLGLGGLAVLVQSIMARHVAAIVLAAIGFLALVFASMAGTGFTSSGETAGSMVMSVLAGVALLCYVVIIYALRPPNQAG